MSEKKYYVIYTRRIAYLLREQGFRIIKTGINPFHPEFDTWYFENTKAFRAALSAFSRIKN